MGVPVAEYDDGTFGSGEYGIGRYGEGNLFDASFGVAATSSMSASVNAVKRASFQYGVFSDAFVTARMVASASLAIAAQSAFADMGTNAVYDVTFTGGSEGTFESTAVAVFSATTSIAAISIFTIDANYYWNPIESYSDVWDPLSASGEWTSIAAPSDEWSETTSGRKRRMRRTPGLPFHSRQQTRLDTTPPAC